MIIKTEKGTIVGLLNEKELALLNGEEPTEKPAKKKAGRKPKN